MAATAGRKPKYTKISDMEKAVDDYFHDCEGHPLMDEDGNAITDKYGHAIIVGAHPPTVTGLALWLGFSTRQSLLDYQHKSDAFNNVIIRAKSRCEEYAERRLYDRQGANGAKFSLANNFKGWDSKTDNTEALSKLDEVLAKMIGGNP